jgi:hypothetical protein
LTFYNLRSTGSLQNNVGVEEKDAIWIPGLIFDNSVEEKLVQNDYFSSLSVQQSSLGIHLFNEILQENIKFKGSKNFMIYSRTYKMDLVCEFEQQKFPFDTQTCSIKVSFFLILRFVQSR